MIHVKYFEWPMIYYCRIFRPPINAYLKQSRDKEREKSTSSMLRLKRKSGLLGLLELLRSRSQMAELIETIGKMRDYRICNRVKLDTLFMIILLR